MPAIKIPEWAFPLVNRIVKLMLATPAHGLMSDSMMVMRYKGRRSGRALATPVRYVRDGETIIASTSTATNWWRNLEDTDTTELLIAGENVRMKPEVIRDNDQVVLPILQSILAAHPADAVYMDVGLKDGKPIQQELLDALKWMVVVRFHPLTD